MALAAARRSGASARAGLVLIGTVVYQHAARLAADADRLQDPGVLVITVRDALGTTVCTLRLVCQIACD